MGEAAGSDDNLNQREPETLQKGDGPLDAATASPSGPETEPPERLNRLIKSSSKMAHDLSQPLTFLLTSLELGIMTGGISVEECKMLLDAVSQMRDTINAFRQNVREAEKE